MAAVALKRCWLTNGGGHGRQSTILFAEIIQITASIALRIVGVFNYNSLGGSAGFEEERVTHLLLAPLCRNNQRAAAATTWMMSLGVGNIGWEDNLSLTLIADNGDCR